MITVDNRSTYLNQLNSKIQTHFGSQLQEAHYIDPGYTSGNDVWRIVLQDKTVYIKVLRPDARRVRFWQGMGELYGIDGLHDIPQHEKLFEFLRSKTDLAVPEIIESGDSTSPFSIPYLVISEVTGTRIQRSDLSLDIGRQFGEFIGRMHSHHYPYWGNILHDQKNGLDEWQGALVKFLSESVPRWFPHEQEMLTELEAVISKIKRLRAPLSFSPIMTDIGWRQFLQSNGELHALIDLDCYVIGARELELTMIEPMLNSESAAGFLKGYEKYQELPSLSDARDVYQYICHAIGAPGVEVLKDWKKYPAWFP